MEREGDAMRPIAFAATIVLAATGSHAANAPPGCQALIAKVQKGYAAAHRMSPAIKAAKCNAYAMVTLDMDDAIPACRGPNEMRILESLIKPLALAVAADEEKYCRR